MPNSTLNIEELSEIINQLPQPIMILGDFNGHHQYWGSNYSDPRGKLIASWLEDNDELVLLNSGLPTHFNARNGNSSCIDLTMVDSMHAADLFWCTIDHTFDSGHFPIVIKIIPSNNCDITEPKEKFLYGKADWILYQEKLDNLLQELPTVNSRVSTSIDEITEEFTEIILKASHTAIPMTTNKNNKN